MEQKKILLIDDDPDVVASVEAMLKSKSYYVVAAFDGDEGLRKVVEERPDLIILDVITPVKHALKVCRELKSDDRYHSFSHIPVLLTIFPQKSFDPQELLSRVEELLEK